jgi:hypothetical protein
MKSLELMFEALKYAVVYGAPKWALTLLFRYGSGVVAEAPICDAGVP